MSFLSMKEYIQINNVNPHELNLEIYTTETTSNNAYPGRWNLPVASEVSILIPNVITHDTHRTVVCIIRDYRNSRIKYFSDYRQSYNPL